MAAEPEAATTSPRCLDDDVVTEILLRLPSSSAVPSARHGAVSPPAPSSSPPTPTAAPWSSSSNAMASTRNYWTPSRFPHSTRQGAGASRFLTGEEALRWSAGFYLHRPSGEHRLLYLTYSRQESHHVYSLEAAEARRLGQAFPVDAFCSERPFVCLNHRGKLHWQQRPLVLFSTDNMHMQHRGVEDASKIVAFDTELETFRRISPPPPLSNRHEGALCLMEIDGELAVAAILKGSMDLWVLEDYNNDETWTCRLRVDLPPTLWHSRFVAVNAGVEEVQNMILLVDGWSHSIWLYDLTERRVSKQIQFGGTRLNALAFRESLKRHAFFDRQDPE
ncbi:hypothetical protein SETIT_9G226300v2 [Setaria italica]|uniref:F-box associated beta-propeller type 3 domain-containing protein n=2 Tax=Setaria italica TaxID=4555 RepID=A0A368SL93_SETIT|nr:hypothetical protein SETIT_9G226300v2 [Setaria italica]